MGAVELGSITSRLLDATYPLGEFFNQGFNLIDSEGMRHLAHDGVGNLGRSDRRFILQEKGECTAARVIKLDCQFCTVFMYRIRQLFKSRYKFVIVQTQLMTAAQSPLPVYC